MQPEKVRLFALVLASSPSTHGSAAQVTSAPSFTVCRRGQMMRTKCVTLHASDGEVCIFTKLNVMMLRVRSYWLRVVARIKEH